MEKKKIWSFRDEGKYYGFYRGLPFRIHQGKDGEWHTVVIGFRGRNEKLDQEPTKKAAINSMVRFIDFNMAKPGWMS